ncbi:MAG: methyltransferase domain-containing protein [Xanthobacteraceae bacterium]
MSSEKMSSEKSKAPVLFDRALLKARQERAVRLGAATFLLDHVANDATERLAAVNRSFASGIDLATPGEVLRAVLERQGVSLRPVEITADDSAALALAPGSIDLAVSLLALQFVNDLPGVLAQVRRALKPDGLLLAAMVGGDTLTELRQAFAAAEAEVEGGASPHVSPFADLRDAGGLLQRAGFALPVTDFERLTVRYDNAFALMQDLRRMGATNVLVERRKSPSRRATLLRMAQIYSERFADPDGRIRATFDIVWLLGWAPDASQPKALRPGSAKFSLEDAVKRAGEKK